MSLTWKDYLKEDALQIYDVELPLNKYGDAEVVLNGDNHLGNPVYDMTKIPMKVMKSQIDYIQKNEHIMVMSMGDDMEAISKRPASHLRNSSRETLIAEEAELYCNLWQEVMHKIIGRVIGNHELRVTREYESFGLSGIPIVDDRIKKENPSCILSEPERGIILRIKVGEQTYKGYFAHGSGGATRPDTHVKKIFEVFEGIDFCALAHIHQTFSNNYPILEIDRSNTPRRKSRIGIRTGTTVPYLAYAEKKALPVSEPSNVIVTLRGDRKQIKTERLMQDRIL